MQNIHIDILIAVGERGGVEACEDEFSCKIISWLHAPIDRYVAAGYGGLECLEKADVSLRRGRTGIGHCCLSEDFLWRNGLRRSFGRLAEQRQGGT